MLASDLSVTEEDLSAASTTAKISKTNAVAKTSKCDIVDALFGSWLKVFVSSTAIFGVGYFMLKNYVCKKK